MDPITAFKKNQREAWATFAVLESITGTAAPRLVRFAKIASGARVLDVACGTGVVALTAARAGARVTGIDLTPELVARARQNAALVGVEIDFHEGDAEALPFGDGAFDVVVSQFGHMFAPRPAIVVKEMLRVLRPGGTLAFSTWPSELFTGRMFTVTGKYAPPPPEGVSSPVAWGDPNVVRERLGAAVTNLAFDRDCMRTPALSIQHFRQTIETIGPMMKLVRMLEVDADKLEAFRRELEGVITEYFENNSVRQDFLLTRATKA